MTLLRIALLIGVALGAAVPSSAGTTTCDTKIIRAQSERSFTEYRVQAVRADRGIVTVLFAGPDDTTRFAVAVRAEGTRFFSSVRHMGLDETSVKRVSDVVARWYENAELQQELARCSQGVRGTAIEDPDSALRSAAERELANRRPVVHLHWSTALLGGAWIAFAVLLSTRRSPTTDSRREQVMLLGLFGYALLLNSWLGSGGPGDLRLNLVSIWDTSPFDLRWGPAPIGLFRLIAIVLGNPAAAASDNA